MNLTTRLQEVIAKHGELAVERERAEKEFRDGWAKTRDEVISLAIDEAADTLRGSDLKWLARPERPNGGIALTIEVEPQGSRTKYQLRFSPDYGKQRVECLAHPDDLLPEEFFELGSLDSAAVDDKIEGFVRAVLSTPRKPPSSASFRLR